MSYSVDRDPKKEPSLTEMALKALDDLYAATKDSEKGFFIMVEASRIVSPILPFFFLKKKNNPCIHIRILTPFPTGPCWACQRRR